MIAIDIGNTSIHFAWFKGLRLIKVKRLPRLSATKSKLLSLIGKRPQGSIVISSVVPQANTLFNSTLKNIFWIGKTIQIPIRSRYNKKMIGSDRLVAAYAAKRLFPKPRLIVDFGTAITLDNLTSDGIYEGGLILPGIG